MPRKHPFPPETDTKPDMQRPSAPAPKSKRARAEAETLPPPPKSHRGKEAKDARDARAAKAAATKSSGVHSRKPPAPRKKDDAPGAAVDEVTADLSKDPRRERDD
jgi:hypothetical protein